MDQRMKALFAREIDEAKTRIADDLDIAEREIEITKRRIESLKKILANIELQKVCNAAETHDFGDEGGGTPMGDRFIEVCKHCGFTNRV